MKHLFSNRSIPLLVSVTMATVTLSTLQAESHCPAGIASVTPRFVQRALIVIPVRINQAGPFDFMVDTGSQVTVVDPSLASELHLKPQGTVGLVSSRQLRAGVADRSGHDWKQTPTLSKSHLSWSRTCGQIQAADPRIRGVLGENFLAHFDLLIDYAHKLLCLDETSAMRESVRGEHILARGTEHPENELPFTERLVISVHLSGTGTRQILLQLDSGSDGLVLYAGGDEAEVAGY